VIWSIFGLWRLQLDAEETESHVALDWEWMDPSYRQHHLQDLITVTLAMAHRKWPSQISILSSLGTGGNNSFG
jgi:hypothetical protein